MVLQQRQGKEMLMPCNLDVEEMLIGRCAFGDDTFSEVYPRLKPDHFYRDAHRRIYTTMIALHGRGVVVSELTVSNQLLSDGEHELLSILNFANSRAYDHLPRDRSSTETYVKIIEQHYTAREVIRVSADAAAAAYEGQTTEAQAMLEELGYQLRMQTPHSHLTPTADLAQEFLDTLEAITEKRDHLLGVTSGLADLDRLFNGFNRSDLIILAARPAVGKTALALNFARNAAKAGSVVALFSLEMGQQQLMRRLVSSVSGVDQERLKTGWLDDEDWERVIEGVKELASIPLYIDDTAGITVDEIKAKCKNLIASGTMIDLVLIDYIQLMQGSATSGRKNREQEVSEISRNLKHLARELDIPVIALAQLSRAVESRQSKVPQLSDLRESGALEQDADIVMFIYRDEVYNPETERRNIADIIVAKHRNGPVGEVAVYFDKAKSTFRNLDVSSTAGEEE